MEGKIELRVLRQDDGTFALIITGPENPVTAIAEFIITELAEDPERILGEPEQTNPGEGDFVG